MLSMRKKPPSPSKSRPLTVTTSAHNRALHYLARRQEYRLPDSLQEELTEVVEGYTGRCDEEAARRGLDWMRNEAG